MLTITNPATEATLAEIPVDTAATIADKASRARRAQPEWAATPLAERKAILARFAELLVRDRDKLAAILSDEVGKPITQARNEINAVGGRIAFFLDNVERVLAPEVVFDQDGMRERISREPLGVVANISAWNYPYFVGSNVFVPALLTGNAVLYKPSEYAALTGRAITEALHQAGVPVNVFELVTGAGSAGATLLDQRVDAVCFTGSYATGMKIHHAAARQLTHVQLELGGKDPAYVCADADPHVSALSLADGAFYNTGQSCCSVERIYVHARVYDAFLESFVAEVKRFKVGDPRDAETYIGPLARKAQLDVLDDQVRDALAQGATLRLGGKRIAGTGYYFEPTVLTEVTNAMKVMRDESFGPIIGIQRVQSDDEAIALMNDTSYGLTAAVYTKDAALAERLLPKLDSGSVYWNCCDRVSPRLPWSGRHHSGLGATLGTDGIRSFTRPKAWHLRTT